MNALVSTQTLSNDADNRKVMSDVRLGLLPVVVEVIREDKGEAKAKALMTTHNLALNDDNKRVIGDSRLGLLPALVEVIREYKGEARLEALMTTWRFLFFYRKHAFF